MSCEFLANLITSGHMISQISLVPPEFIRSYTKKRTDVISHLLRHCHERLGDYKLTVNRVANLECYPLPRIDDLLASLGN